ncbi:MAG: DinB family protein [Gemmatimonadota bacterium]|nr:DinB family protein [Gemmatimonadota bacterium]
MTVAKRAPKAAPPPFELGQALLRSLDTNDRITRYLIENLSDEAWRAEPPGGKGREIAAMVSHVHNVRVMWLKATAKGSAIPGQLDRKTVTRKQALDGLTKSHAALRRVLESSLAEGGRVKGFKPDVAGFFGYLVSHDAHHRGQISMLSRQLGHPISQKAMFGMWEWGSRSLEVE